MEGESPQPRRIVMLSAFDGWNDAGQVATHALNHLISTYASQSREVDHICCGSFYDYTSTRPVMVNVDGKRKIMWPETTFTRIDVNPTLSLLIEMGPEPNFKWTEFAQRSLRIADEYEVDEVITLGSMFADCAHTRPLPVYFHDTYDNTAEEESYTGPIGITSVLNFAALEDGFQSASLWVSLPSYTQYVDSQDNPMGVLRAIEKLSEHLGVQLDKGDLPVLALKWKTQADMLTEMNPDIKGYISKMEKAYDEEQNLKALSPDATSQLINETEKYLRGFDAQQ